MIDWYGRISDWIDSLVGLPPGDATSPAPGFFTAATPPVQLTATTPPVQLTAVRPPPSNRVLFRAPVGSVQVAGDWSHVKAKLGPGPLHVASGQKLWETMASLWWLGTTKTWVSHMTFAGNNGYAKVMFGAQTLGVLSLEQDTVIDLPAFCPVAQVVPLTNSAVWTWAGDKVWYHFYESRVTVTTWCPVVVPGMGPIQPTIVVTLGGVSWSLPAWARKAVAALWDVWGYTGWDKILDIAFNFIAKRDPTRGLGLQVANKLVDIGAK